MLTTSKELGWGFWHGVGALFLLLSFLTSLLSAAWLLIETALALAAAMSWVIPISR